MDFWQSLVKRLEHDWEPLPSKSATPYNGWTLRDGLVETLGCDRRLGFMGYWEFVELSDRFQEVALLLGGADVVDRWSNMPGRTWNEIEEAITTTAQKSPLELGALLPTLRPFSDKKYPLTGCIPFVQLAAVCQFAFMNQPEQPLEHFLTQLNIEPTTDPWTILSQVDPHIAFQEASAEARKLTAAMNEHAKIERERSTSEPYLAGQLISPARILWLLAKEEEPASVAELAVRLEARNTQRRKQAS
jgi:hypothetical protein